MKQLLQTLFFFLMVTQICFAQWVQTNYANYGIIDFLEFNGTNLFAGNISDVFISTNNGTDWTLFSNALPADTWVLCLVTNGTDVFVGSINHQNGANGGIFLSTDNGTSWIQKNNGLTRPYVNALALSGTNIFAGTAGDGVFLSTNNGTNWTLRNNGLTNTVVRCFAVSDTNLFVGTDAGVYRSTNHGTDWTQCSTGDTVYSLAAKGSNIFAGTQGDGVYLSTNNGTNWTQVNNGLTCPYVNALALSGTNIFAAIDCDGVFSFNQQRNRLDASKQWSN